MKNPLHRKKLQLALNAFTTKVVEKSSELDYIWVTRKALLTRKMFNFTCCMFSFESHLQMDTCHKPNKEMYCVRCKYT